jgi:hypothetical protein
MNREPKPNAEEARGRRFAALMEHSYNWRKLTGEQMEQVLSMAEAIHEFMKSRRRIRESNP